MPQQLLNEKQAADRLGLTPRTLQQWRTSGRGPRYVRISSRCVRYDVAELDAWTEARTHRSTSEEAAGA